MRADTRRRRFRQRANEIVGHGERKDLADQSGATAIEYCLIAAGISIVIVTVVNGLGSTLNTKYTSVSTALK